MEVEDVAHASGAGDEITGEESELLSGDKRLRFGVGHGYGQHSRVVGTLDDRYPDTEAAVPGGRDELPEIDEVDHQIESAYLTSKFGQNRGYRAGVRGQR
jgi:hypothetical protein